MILLNLKLLLLLPFTAAFLPVKSNNKAIRSPRPQPSTGNSLSAAAVAATPSSADNKDGRGEFSGFGDTGFLILAGGTGSRMKASMPKQFLTLRTCPVLHYSLHLFLEKLPQYCAARGVPPPAQVVLVLDPRYQPDYQAIVDAYDGRLAFADPGAERQGSVENGLKKLVELAGDSCEFVAVHDSARPLVTVPEILDVVADARDSGAAVLGVPCKATIKESADGQTVLRTIPRERLWEVHTPQVVQVEALGRGFAKVEQEGLEVTDDVSIIEALGEPVTLTRGEYTNLKITTPEDMDVACAILAERGEEEIALAGGGSDNNGGAGESEGAANEAALAAVVDLSSASTPTGTAAALKSPFASSQDLLARDKFHNRMTGSRFTDTYPRDRVEAPKPTPSQWYE